MPFRPTAAPLARALAERDYHEPTPVQDAVLDPALAGRDLLVSAQTGSGKTVAYGLAVGVDLLGGAETLGQAGSPLTLIVAPTRELALQVTEELTWLMQYTGARVVACVGGMDPRREQRRLADGAHIVVGTPGRLRDHLERRNLVVDALKAVVLDEADEMLDLGFREDLEFLLEATPAERRTLLFSATLPKDIVTLARRYQDQAARIEVAGAAGGHADIAYRAVRVAPRESEHAVVNLLRQVEAPAALVFCNTRESVRHLSAVLLERGFAVVSLSGELSQPERNRAMQALRDGRARVCVATDVAARGIDLPSLGLVIHADLPHDAEVLQHRSGRTGRAGRKGISVLLVPHARRRKADQLIATAGIQPEWSGPPTADDIRRLDQERMMQDPLLAEPPGEDELAMARALLAERPAETIAAALVRLYRGRLPAAEEVGDPGPGRPPREKSPRQGGEDGDAKPAASGNWLWFRLAVGRKANADAKWLLPMICRRGKVTRHEVGAIRIFDRETKFAIAEEVAERFATTVRRSQGEDEPHIEPIAGGEEHRGPTRTPQKRFERRQGKKTGWTPEKAGQGKRRRG